MIDKKIALRTWLYDLDALRSLLPPTIDLVERIDEGGQGIVFKGVHEGKLAAIKLYYPGQIAQRIEREVNALRSINCASIAPLFWSGEIEFEGEQLPVVITEFVEGTNLKNHLAARTPLLEEEIERFLYDGAIAISALWDLRIVHRDLKPDNIIQRTNGRFCIIDLGLARHLQESSLTTMGATWGTYGYLSPEQTRMVRQLSCKSDIFSLGVIAVEAALGRHPTNRDQIRLLSSKFHENLPHEITHFACAPLLKKMLSSQPIQRPLPEVIIKQLSLHAPQEQNNGS